MRIWVLAASLVVMTSSACRLGSAFESVSLHALAPPTPDWHAARVTLRGELSLDLPPGLSPAETLSGANAARVRQLVEWQLQYLHGAIRHSDADAALAKAAFLGRRDLQLLGVTVGARPTTATVTYEFRDVVVARKEFEASEVELRLPRDVASIFAKTLAVGGPNNACAGGLSVPDEHLWFFWDPAAKACRLTADDVVAVRAQVEPMLRESPASPDYRTVVDGHGENGKVQAVYIIGDDHAYQGDGGRAAYVQAVELLSDGGFSVRAQRPDGRGVVMQKRVGKTVVSLEVRLVDPTSFEFVKASASALESADVFVYNGQSGFGNYLDWSRFERILGRRLELPAKSQIFAFNGASPFTFETMRLFSAKATTADPEGFASLDVVQTAPGVAPIVGGAVAIDVALLAGLLGEERPNWAELLRDVRRAGQPLDLMTYVTGGR